MHSGSVHLGYIGTIPGFGPSDPRGTPKTRAVFRHLDTVASGSTVRGRLPSFFSFIIIIYFYLGRGGPSDDA